MVVVVVSFGIKYILRFFKQLAVFSVYVLHIGIHVLSYNHAIKLCVHAMCVG